MFQTSNQNFKNNKATWGHRMDFVSQGVSLADAPASVVNGSYWPCCMLKDEFFHIQMAWGYRSGQINRSLMMFYMDRFWLNILKHPKTSWNILKHPEGTAKIQVFVVAFHLDLHRTSTSTLMSRSTSPWPTFAQEISGGLGSDHFKVVNPIKNHQKKGNSPWFIGGLMVIYWENHRKMVV